MYERSSPCAHRGNSRAQRPRSRLEGLRPSVPLRGRHTPPAQAGGRRQPRRRGFNRWLSGNASVVAFVWYNGPKDMFARMDGHGFVVQRLWQLGRERGDCFADEDTTPYVVVLRGASGGYREDIVTPTLSGYGWTIACSTGR